MMPLNLIQHSQLPLLQQSEDDHPTKRQLRTDELTLGLAPDN
jgi:hypothetical protein